MNLVVDIGNTNVKALIMDKGRVCRELAAQELSDEPLKELIRNYAIRQAIVCSVGDAADRIFSLLKNNVEFCILLDSKTPIPIPVKYKTIQTLGMDRVAMAVGAQVLYGVRNALLVDLGTAITMDVLLEGCFMGGNISPGVEMRLRSLHEWTSHLPKVDACSKEDDTTIWGNSTRDAILKGVIHGIASEIDGMRRELSDAVGQLPVILGGGGAKLFVNRIKNAIFADGLIVCCGLNEILEFNARNL